MRKFVISALVLISNLNAQAQMGMENSQQGMAMPPAPKMESKFYNNQCPFFDPSEARFKTHIEELKNYLENQKAGEKKCTSIIGKGLELNNLQLAMGRYRQFMGLDGGSSGMSEVSYPMESSMGMQTMGSSFGMYNGGMSSGGSRKLTCFNTDQYYKEEAEAFLINQKNNLVVQTSGDNYNPAPVSSFSSCALLEASKVEACVAEKRVSSVSTAKLDCQKNQNYQAQKAEFTTQLDTIQKGSALLKNVLSNPDCVNELPKSVLKGVISLGTEVASFSAPGLTGVAIAALGELLGTLVDLFTGKSAAEKGQTDISNEDHFRNTACLFNNFQNELYSCQNNESRAFKDRVAHCYIEGVKNPGPLGGSLTSWFRDLTARLPASNVAPMTSNEFFKNHPIGNSIPPLTYDSIIEEAKGQDCELRENKRDAGISYTALKSALDCLAKKESNNKTILDSIKNLPNKETIAEWQNKISKTNTAPKLLGIYRDLQNTNNKITANVRAEFGCPKKEEIKGAREALGSEAAINESKEKYQKVLQCLSAIVVSQEVMTEDQEVSTYYALVDKETEYQNRYIVPYLELTQPSEVSQSIQNKFSTLIRVMKDDSRFKSHLSNMYNDAETNYASSINQEGKNPVTSILPIFKACLHLNAMSFLDLGKSKSSDNQDAIQMSQQSPFRDCEKFNCLLPKPDWSQEDNKKVQKYQSMACSASQVPAAFEKKLVARLTKIKSEHKANPQNNGKDIEEICGRK